LSQAHARRLLVQQAASYVDERAPPGTPRGAMQTSVFGFKRDAQGERVALEEN
jgi:hypothetical protein